MSLTRFFPCLHCELNDSINKLDYSNYLLTEGFPQVWQHERTLEELNISSTRINYLPPQLFYCLGLKILLANNNNLESIPEAVRSLCQLQHLELNRNFILNVPDGIKSCKNLTHMDLSCNSLRKLPEVITCLISLQELILNETCLEFLPANFGRLINLRVVELRSNNLVSLPRSIQRLINLERLDIGCNEFTKVPEVIGELKQLRELWFDLNQIETVPIDIGKLRELVHCEANGNCINYLPNDIGNWVNMEVLSISMNNLTILPSNVGMFKSLVTFKCESNELDELPNSISKLENLEELVVSHNKLICLPNTIGMLRKLRYLFADNNNLKKLPDDMCSCSVLTIVSVSRNELCTLPDNIGHLKNLKVLNIVQNYVTVLPLSLLSLMNLTSLWICHNQSQPLMPLQYIEISKRTHLTCFMLPQLGCGQKPIDAIKNRNDVVFENQNQKKSLGNTACKPKIGFAEEPTILQLSLIPKSNANYSVLPNINNGSKKSTCVLNPNDLLMRSPTPYPKELRLMAKYVQSNNHKISNHSNINNRKRTTMQETRDNPTNAPSSICSSNYVSFQNVETTFNECFLKCEENHRNVPNKTPQKLSPVIETRQYCLDNISKFPSYLITKYEFQRKLQEKNRLQRYNKYMESLLYINDIGCKKDLTAKDIKRNQNNSNTQQQSYRNAKYEKTSKSVDIYTQSKNPITLNNCLKKKCNESRSKWLFGVHKNPMVIQVNINCESCRDFEIDVLPNKEGIYVISTNPPQLIKPLDKLLEVDGVDFTNISVNEARNVLKCGRPSISIMLSR